MIEIRDLSFGYKRQPVFTDVGLRLEPGNIYGLLGINGAGKSTLLKLMAGLLFADSGSVRWRRCDPAAREPGFLADVFMLPEDARVPNVLDRDYVKARAPFYPAFDQQQFERYLREFDLPQGQRLTSLSHGQQRKFLLAFGLASQARLLLLDEPTNGLDIPSKSLFRRTVAEAVTDERLIVISTHQVREVGTLIDPIVILHQGRVLLNRALAEIGARVRMAQTASRPPPDSPGLLFSEPTVGGFCSVWQDSAATDGVLDLEVLFNAIVARPEIATSVLAGAGGAA